jgi:hypothetical protein
MGLNEQGLTRGGGFQIQGCLVELVMELGVGK